MQPLYLINNAIYFYPEVNKLVSVAEEEKEIILTQPATKCLELLLKTDGLVSQKELYDYAWGENSQNVAPNTLYQNISIIRRALKRLYPDAQLWLITVPRQGFRFEHNIPVTLVTAETVSSLSVVAEEENRISSVISADTPIRLWSLRSIPLKAIVIIIVICLIFTLVALVLPVNNNFHTLAASYYRIQGSGDCNLYLHKNNRMPEQHIIDLINKRVNCKRYPYVYIIHNVLFEKISLFTCRKPLGSNDFACASWSLRESQ
ncbi:winged helix-turn-helix domain-containing protein [Mixta intestinalis]|jgi:DNA-binding winged helix-turn-helix (wHTH) protein|uniref:OmpR/PhoB-type domain-containing protein n=1 Tax=Mixta intestinalis TaxID=1615494 RepID=A0A6P1Q5Q7_9GAMM|nr:winged helix-turn-helix domain-containing protein [Mixta intestinalis]QHM73389.1 hypothetical protein C7M51_03736 [Mixta intestinalis]